MNLSVHSAEGDFEGAVDIMIKAFEDIPGILETVKTDIIDFATDIYDGISGTFQDLLPVITKWTDDVDAAILGGLEATIGLVDAMIGRIVPGWGDIKQQVGEWVTTNITEPFTLWTESIFLGADIIWKAIIGTESMLTEVGTWVTTNIVDPIKTFYENDSILVGAAQIWESIVGTATDITETINTWLTDNIITPIKGLPNLIVSQGLEIVKAVLGFASPLESESVSKVGEWNQAMTDEIAKVPTLIVDQASAILDGLLKGDVGAGITNWVNGVWSTIKSEFDKLIAGVKQHLLIFRTL